MKKISSLVLISGGLDSMLAAKLMLEQNIAVTGLVFKSLFFDSQAGQKSCQQLGIDCRVVDISEEHLAIVKKPCFGRGRAANPCVDCHLLMLKKAGEIMRSQSFGFVVTGEVLGSRPFSQNQQALSLLTKKSGLGERLLRPLSARLLPKTLPEKKEWVSQKALLSISGRSRKVQMKMAKKYRLIYSQPAGGCILTEKGYSQKLLKMFKKWPDCTAADVKLLRLGRIFWFGSNLVVLGRNKEENEHLEKITHKNDLLIIPQNFSGPTARLRGQKKPIEQAKQLIVKHSKHLKNQAPRFKLSRTS